MWRQLWAPKIIYQNENFLVCFVVMNSFNEDLRWAKTPMVQNKANSLCKAPLAPLLLTPRTRGKSQCYTCFPWAELLFNDMHRHNKPLYCTATWWYCTWLQPRDCSIITKEYSIWQLWTYSLPTKKPNLHNGKQNGRAPNCSQSPLYILYASVKKVFPLTFSEFH